MRKKLLSVVLISALTMSTLAACGSKSEEPAKPTVMVTDAPTMEPTAEPTQEPTAVPEAQPTEEPTVVPEEPVAEYSTEEVETAGSIDGQTYTNSHVGFSITLPETWLVYSSEDTYEYVVTTQGGTEADITTLKSALSSQGISYPCYGMDTQVSESGRPSNIIVQAMNASLFGELGIDLIISSLSSLIEQQFTQMGATCTVGDATKTTIGEQDVYLVPASATMEVQVDAEGNTVPTTVYQQYIIFLKNGTLIYAALSTASEDSATLAQSIVDTLDFQ